MTVGCGGRVSGADLGARLTQLAFAADMINLEFAKVAAAFAETDEYDEQGFDSAISWIKANCHLPGGAAADRLCVGEQLENLRQSRMALGLGEIGFAHFALIARTAAAVGEGFDEARLVRQARKESVAKFRNTCTHARHAGDPQGFVAEEVEGVEARSLTFTTADDGVVLLQGILDKVGGAALKAALEPLARRAGKDDDRDRERRMADALVDLSMRALDNGLVPQRAHLQVTASLETLLGLPGAAGANMEFSLPISAKAVERIACDCAVTRIVLGSDSTVIDVGRAKRTISGPQRKALKVRDGGCTWPGCDRPVSMTEGHHLIHWINNGPGDLPNLTLLCYRHHWMVHEGEWQIVRTDDGRLLTIPPQTGFERLPRGPD